MILLLRAEFALTVVVCLAFLVAFGLPGRHHDRVVAYHLAVFTLATALEAASLYAAASGLALPIWVYVGVFGLVAFAATWRLVLYLLATGHQEEPMVSTATQTRHPWRATLRTAIAATVGLLPLVPELLADVHLNTTAIGVQVIAIAAGVTRFLARPAVEAWMHAYAPWLAAQPQAPGKTLMVGPPPPSDPTPVIAPKE